MENIVSKSCFKPKALKFFHHVQETGQELIIMIVIFIAPDVLHVDIPGYNAADWN